MIRIAHFSDIHISARPLGWRPRDLLTKRATGWFNYHWLGRRRRFRHADEVLTTLAAELRARRPDHLIFSGDATALGFETELKRATEILGLNEHQPVPGLAVPGNHDYYTRFAANSGLFERYFASWQTGERVDGNVYPFAQRLGHTGRPFWLIGVNSCTGNRLAWDAAGSVDAPQLDRLGRLLEGLAPGPRILVTHYPVCLASGKRERRVHGLRNLADLVSVAARGGVCLWLHGHRHTQYHHRQCALAPFPIICAGSATQSHHWSYNEYAIEGSQMHVTRRLFVLEKRMFREADGFDLELLERMKDEG